MCGRFTNRYSWQELHALYHLTAGAPPSNFEPRYNIAPTQEVPVVRVKDARRDLAIMKWGLVPTGSKDMKDAAKMINARAETVADKPAFRSAFRHRRCLVIADGFYEWKKITPKEKLPWFITLKEKAPFAFAGLYEKFYPREGSSVETFAIITCAPNTLIAPLHDRMPVILGPEQWRPWLGEELVSPDKLKSLLKPFPPEKMDCWPVDKRVGNIANEDAALVEKVEA
jgi:putative SOS response-associated peptidase YedK